MLASLSLGGCADSAALAATGSDVTVLVDLGRHPPRLRAELTATVPALEDEATLTSVWQTCGCIAPKLLAGGDRVERDGMVARGAALQVQAVYEPRPASGEVFERIDLGFRAARGATLFRRVRIRTEGSRTSRWRSRARPGASYEIPVGYAILVTAAAGGAPDGR